MINKVILIGNLGKEPELHTFENGSKVCNLTMATNESYKDKNGEWQNLTEWHTLKMYGDYAENLMKLKKGQLVFAEGKIKSRKNEKDGVERYSTEIHCTKVRSMIKSEDSTSKEEGGLPF